MDVNTFEEFLKSMAFSDVSKLEESFDSEPIFTRSYSGCVKQAKVLSELLKDYTFESACKAVFLYQFLV